MSKSKTKFMTKTLSTAIRGLCRGEHHRFMDALVHPREAQRELLREILKAHETTEFGKSYGLSAGLSEKQFRERLPMSDFNEGDLAQWIERQRSKPKQSILSPGGIQVFEKTSGSSGKQKLIPYNQALLKSFERYFRIWVYDLLSHGPQLESYRLFISISPAFRKPDEIREKIGFEDDSQYLSPILRFFLKHFLTVPLDIKSIQDPDRFRDVLCSHLAADEDLEILSLWHPSLFLVLWDHLITHRSRISGLVEPRNKKAAALLRSEMPLRPALFWPELKLVSAWDASHSALAARELQSLLPYAYFQGKGLLATEAPMTLPLIGHGAIPFVTDVLFEFMDSDGNLHWIDELKDGRDYSLIVSQRGGLLRYRIRDRVRAYATTVGAPCLEFIERESDTCDLVGEKLSANYVSAQENDFVQAHGNRGYIFLPVLPADSKGIVLKPGYVILADTPDNQPLSGPSAVVEDQGLARWWEERLAHAVHYDYARKLGQLGPVQAYQVPKLKHRLLDYYVRERGMKAGDVKLSLLLNNPEESRRILSHMRIL